MRLRSVAVQNYRSIVDTRTQCPDGIRIERLQAFVGENNAGKSNILRAIGAFLAAGAGGVTPKDFHDDDTVMIIGLSFADLTPTEQRRFRKYLIGGELRLEKQLIITEKEGGRLGVTTEYHGYLAKPKDWWLSSDSVVDREGSRPKWEAIAGEHGLSDYVRGTDVKVNKASYELGLERYLAAREDTEYEEPKLGQTQALGLQTALLAQLPSFRLLPAVTDYADEVDRRSSSTTFRQLMGDLAERILRTDPRYREVEEAKRKIAALLNAAAEGEETGERPERLAALAKIEELLANVVRRMMPGVSGVRLEVQIDDTQEIFARGVSLKVNDGVLTDVLDKGHGLQRAVVFGLLQTLIENQRGALLGIEPKAEEVPHPLVLAIEEPELYIHPQLQRLMYGILRDFAEDPRDCNQVLYSTHAPAFVDVAAYHQIAVVTKRSVPLGTQVHQCEEGALGSLQERKAFQLLTHFGLEHNELFFARKCILVEGRQDRLAIVASGRELALFKEFPEEAGHTVMVAGNKQELPKFQKLLNAFALPYVLLLEMDGKGADDPLNAQILDLLGNNHCVSLPRRLEDALGHEGHFGNDYSAAKFVEDPRNLTDEWKDVVQRLFSSSRPGPGPSTPKV